MSALSIISAICKYLQAQAAVTAVVGTRVYPGRMPQKFQHPFMIVQTVRGENVDSDDGESVMWKPIIGVNIYGETEDDEHAMREAVKNALNNEMEVIVAGSGLKLEEGIYIDERDTFDATVDVKGKEILFEMWYSEV
jgi:hypothetical protein